jgi:DnaK suppressor protein
MATPTRTPTQRRKPEEKRRAELVDLLQARRRELTEGVREQLRRARDGADEQQSEDTSGEGVSARDDISLALAQVQAETLQRIDAALARLAAGRYGDCAECGAPIPSQRLRALPFAVRCLDCEASRESGPAKPSRRWNDEPGDVSPKNRRVLGAL